MTRTNSTGEHASPDTEYAIVDLGSNSFHLVVARVRGGTLHVLDRIKEVTRLAEGLRSDGTLAPEKQEQVLEVLRGFGQRLAPLEARHVRVIGTSALRSAKKAEPFVRQAETLLGHPIEIIDGREEARLIYTGVALWHPMPDKRRLVADIGGSSTEIALGHGVVPTTLDSLEIGNIRLTRRVFGDKAPSRDLFAGAVEDVVRHLRGSDLWAVRDQWEIAYGASGTMRVVEKLLVGLGLTTHGITRAGLDEVVEMMVRQKKSRRRVLGQIPADRVSTFPAALAILRGIFESFDISRMLISQAGVREGLLYDLTHVHHARDRRRQTVKEMMDYYGVDKQQAARMERFVQTHLPRIADSLELERDQARAMLGWACRLHEAGLALSHRGYHKHGAYIVRHSRMPGFTKREQAQLATLILNQRKRIKTTHSLAAENVDEGLTALFRLAYLLNRSRREDWHDPVTQMAWDPGRSFVLSLEPGWLERHPLTREDLRREIRYWEEVGVRYRLDEAEPS